MSQPWGVLWNFCFDSKLMCNLTFPFNMTTGRIFHPSFSASWKWWHQPRRKRWLQTCGGWCKFIEKHLRVLQLSAGTSWSSIYHFTLHGSKTATECWYLGEGMKSVLMSRKRLLPRTFSIKEILFWCAQSKSKHGCTSSCSPLPLELGKYIIL